MEGPHAALEELAARTGPDLLVATGDLAHRGKRSELERAHALVTRLAIPLLAVPGNHDIPYTVPARFTQPFAEWERVFGSTEPVHESQDLVVVGMSSVRPWRQQGGAVPGGMLETATARIRDAPKQALRIVALHHHVTAPPWRAARKRPLKRRGDVLAALSAAGAELIIGGHVHQASVSEVREFQARENERAGSVVLATAAGLGRPRPHRSGEALGLNVYESDAQTLTVVTFAWDGTTFSEVGRRSFARG
jgi:3',5'-cyclic AMP phosphodiesterase CpdA